MLLLLALLVCGCGGDPYPPKHETPFQRADRLVCEHDADHAHRHSHGSDDWRADVLRCVKSFER